MIARDCGSESGARAIGRRRPGYSSNLLQLGVSPRTAMVPAKVLSTLMKASGKCGIFAPERTRVVNLRLMASNWGSSRLRSGLRREKQEPLESREFERQMAIGAPDRRSRSERARGQRNILCGKPSALPHVSPTRNVT